MGFEPEVEKRIAWYRRRALKRKAVIFIPIMFIVAMSLFMLINILGLQGHIQKTAEIAQKITSPTDEPVTVHHYMLVPAILIPVLVWGVLTALFLAAYYYAILQPVARQYRFLTGFTGAYNRHRYHLFTDSLEGASIAAGIPPPKLLVVNMPTANALTFEAGGRLAVGVTPEMLEADLSQHEVEAVMAHHAAHIKMKSGLKAPISLSPKTMIIVTCLAFLLPLVAGITLGNELIAMLPLLFAPFLPVWTKVVVQPYLPWKRLTYYEAILKTAPLYQLRAESLPDSTPAAGPGHDEDLVADSLAVKITSNPSALKNAILKLIDLMESAPVMPAQTITFPHLFIGPLKKWDATPPSWPALRLKGFFISRGSPVPNEESVATEMRSFILVEENLLSERVANLDAIDGGVWREFEEIRGGEVRTSAEGWE